MFVFAIMVIAGSKPILEMAGGLVRWLGRLLPLGQSAGMFFSVLAILPLLGSFITEPAAMTVAALVLQERYFSKGLSTRFKYAALGVLFVNVSIGGTLTPFAAPPILMVARSWDWSLSFMLTTFGWKAALAVVINALGLTLLFRRELGAMELHAKSNSPTAPIAVSLVHLIFLTGVVLFAHDPKLFMGLFLFFLGFTYAYPRYQSRLILREGLLVAFFLAGLVVLGGQQQWWLQILLAKMNAATTFFGATALTAVTDNAALTYSGLPCSRIISRVQICAGGRCGNRRRLDGHCQCPESGRILDFKRVFPRWRHQFFVAFCRRAAADTGRLAGVLDTIRGILDDESRPKPERDFRARIEADLTRSDAAECCGHDSTAPKCWRRKC